MKLQLLKQLTKTSKFLIVILFLISFSAKAEDLVSKEATWKYYDSFTAPPATWKTTGFNDSGWSSGAGDLGFGNSNNTTITNHGGYSYYFRHSFTVSDTSNYTDFLLELMRDDGAVIYINGTEVWRNNMPSGAITHTTKAASTVGGGAETTYYTTTLSDILVNGTNVIAAEVHQVSSGSSDVTFDFALTGNTVPPYVDFGDTWKYLDDGSNQGTAWYDIGFSDVSWSSGAAELGYGDGDEATTVSYGGDATNKHVTTYFRKTFTATGFSSEDFMELSMIRDDGAIVYLNGNEVWRSNMTTGAFNYTTLATGNVSGSSESTPEILLLPATSLVNGSNVIAVEIHQDNVSSSDISMDFKIQNIGAPNVTLDRGPYLQILTKTGVNIKWRTNVPTNSFVAYGSSPVTLNDTVWDVALDADHEVQISGLTPNTKYFYSIGKTDTTFVGGDVNHFFTTAPIDSYTGLTRAWVLGDAGTANANQRAVRDAYLSYVGAGKTDMVLMLGDNAYNDGTDEQYQNAVFENMYEDVLRQTVTYSCPGNHDIYSANSSTQTGPYYDIFSFPKAGEAGGLASGTEAYYSWDYGQIHFISLDSDDSPRSVGGSMYTWLNNDLAATTKKWIVVIFHHPPYTKGSHDSDDATDSGGRMRDMRENVLPLLESYGVDLVLSGHSHSYERSYLLNGHYDVSGTLTPSMKVDAASGKLDVDCSYKKTTSGPDAGKGAVYITAGSSGKITGTLTAHPAMYAYLYQLGSVVVEVEKDRMDVKFINNSGNITDYFAVDKDIINAATDITIENGNSTTLTASWGDDFSWSPGGATTASITVSPSDTTQYIVKNASGCLADTFNVNVRDINIAPSAIDNPAASTNNTISIDVLSNDSDADGDNITITSITTAPNNGGTVAINDNGTPSNPADDFIDYTPSGSYFGVETFEYSICDDAAMPLCDTAQVAVTVTDCADGSTTVGAPNFSYGAEWKYHDSGANLGTAWVNKTYNDKCWSFGDAKLGFGDLMTTIINKHSGATYYFRKHFNVTDVTAVNYIKLDLVRDDGAVIYINGTEVFRTNMPSGLISYTTLASTNITGAAEVEEQSISIPASLLSNGDNVIAVEIHQDNTSSSDVSFDLKMTQDLVDHADSILIDLMQCWNYNDNGIDLGSSWKGVSLQENANDWEAGQAELGYGDGDESTILEFGGDPINVYKTSYFRHYFSVNDFEPSDSLLIKLRRDDGAIVYINGVEVVRSNMPNGAVNYNTTASYTVSAPAESELFEYKHIASVLNTGTNVIAVEVHQVNSISSDLTFDLELSIAPGDPNNFVWEYDKITGQIFIDADFNRSLSVEDIGSGALLIEGYQDKNKDGEIDASDPLVATDVSLADGSYELELFPAEVAAITAGTASSPDDAIEDGTSGTMSLTASSMRSIDLSGGPTQLYDSTAVWKYYDAGLPSGSWKDGVYDDSGWSSGGGSLGFGDSSFITTFVTGGETAFYFRKQITIADPSAANFGAALARLKIDDGIVVYINGNEVLRRNMPDGVINHSSLAIENISTSDEYRYGDFLISSPGFVTGINTIAVEVHQDNPSSTDIHFGMELYSYSTDLDLIGLRFPNVTIPQGANIVDAWLVMKADEGSNSVISAKVNAEAIDDSPIFASSAYNISSRTKTTTTLNWLSDFPVLSSEEIKIDGLAPLISEVIDRVGWSSGNALSLILSGYENRYLTYDGGTSPSLVIAYADTANPSVNYIVNIKEDALPKTYLYMTEDNPVVTFSKSARAVSSGINIGYLGTTSMCFASSDDQFDDLHIINRFNGANTAIGPFGGGDREIEAIALSRSADSLFAVDGDSMGIIDVITGQFNSYGNVIGTGNGSLGAYTFSDIDGLAFDLDRNLLWATQRRSGAPDLILIIDHTTGLLIPNIFGPGNDYVVATGGGLLEDLDDIAVNPITGNLFAMNNNGGLVTNLIEIDVTTGIVSVINTTGLNDMEGQGFHNDGSFYSTSGRIGIPSNVFYQVDPTTAALTPVGFFKTAGDFEGCDCKSGPFLSLLEGVVFDDTDVDGIYDEGTDVLDEGVLVYLYEDLDGDSMISAGDAKLDSVLTDSLGAFFFAVNRKGVFLVEIRMTDLPTGSSLTTTDLHEARFILNGNFDGENDFGYRNASVLPVELISFNGEHKNHVNRLYWMTASEINSSHFNIQRSADGIHFKNIGIIEAAGFSNEELNYNFIDQNPFSGTNYYRLQIVDIDGSFEYSRTIEISMLVALDEIKLSTWPNPAKENINVNGLQKFIGEYSTIRIIDAYGKVVSQKNIKIVSNKISIPLKAFADGYFILEISSGNLKESISFIKQ